MIRPLSSEDEPFLWDALYHAIYVPPGAAAPRREIVRRPEIARYVEGWMRRDGDAGFGAMRGDVLVAAAWLRLWTASDRGYGFVDETVPELSLSVLPEYRGSGLGTALLRAVLDYSALRYRGLSLSVSRPNPARRLYEREGFSVAGESDGQSITMVKWFVPRALPDRD